MRIRLLLLYYVTPFELQESRNIWIGMYLFEDPVHQYKY